MNPAGPPPPSGPGMGFVLSHEQFPTAQLVDQAQAAEQAGFRYLWASDHIQPVAGQRGPQIAKATQCPRTDG